MEQVQVPIYPVPERTKFSDFMELSGKVWEAFTKDTGINTPVFIFEPYEAPRHPAPPPRASEAPEEIIVVSMGQGPREAIFEALKRIETREPKLQQQRPLNITLKPNTPLKSIYRQMAEVPATVFSLTLGEDSDAGAIFFIRTGFTVNQLRHEMNQPVK